MKEKNNAKTKKAKLVLLNRTCFMYMYLNTAVPKRILYDQNYIWWTKEFLDTEVGSLSCA